MQNTDLQRQEASRSVVAWMEVLEREREMDCQ